MAATERKALHAVQRLAEGGRGEKLLGGRLMAYFLTFVTGGFVGIILLLMCQSAKREAGNGQHGNGTGNTR